MAMYLVIGGSASGKSALAEELTMKCLGDGGRATYLATMEPYGEEAEARIHRHRCLREGKSFETIELPRCIGKAAEVCHRTVLLESLSNLLANEMFTGGALDLSAGKRVLYDIRLLIRSGVQDIIIVSDDLFSGGTDYAKETLCYMKELGNLHCILAQEARKVVEVVAGMPIFWKG